MVNQQEIEFHDTENHGCEFDSTVHDMDTSVDELLVMQNETFNTSTRNNPRKVMMNRATWDKLSAKGKTIWDQLSQEDKELILTYAQNRGTMNASQQG